MVSGVFGREGEGGEDAPVMGQRSRRRLRAMESASVEVFMAAVMRGKARRRAPERRKRKSTTRKERRILLAMVGCAVLKVLGENGFRGSGCG